MELNIAKVSNTILYMIKNKVAGLNDKKISILLFLMEYNHQKDFNTSMFNETFIKDTRNPEPVILGDIFNIIANDKDVDEEDERLYIIQELLAYLDIEIISKGKYNELKFIKMEEDFDKDLFTNDEFKILSKITKQYKVHTARNLANVCFDIEKVRQTPKGEVII